MIDSRDQTEAVHLMHGLGLSYFTGKLQAYFQVKGVRYRFIEMNSRDFRRCAKATGIAQMPQVEAPDGSWLTDTSAIISRFERERAAPALHPQRPADRFFSVLLEDMFDEWFWRPALYYRWAFAPDAWLMSGQIAATLLRDVSLPFSLRRRFVLWRQKREYLRGDGVTPKTARQIEKFYPRILAMLDPILTKRPFLFGERPCEADFGLFGPMFRHFSYDPTPAAIMRDKAPNVLEWTARLWALRPAGLGEVAPLEETPVDLQPLIAMASHEYLPYLQANAEAVAAQTKMTKYRSDGVEWQVPSAPYRAKCLETLQTAYAALGRGAKQEVKARLSPEAVRILEWAAIPSANSVGPADDAAILDRMGNQK